MNVLFYSPSCRFCSEAVRRAVAVQQQQQQQQQMQQQGAPRPQKLVMVSVDSAAAKGQLPPFVDRVPLLFTADRRVLLEDRLLAFLDALLAAGHQDPAAIECGDDAAFSWLDQDPASSSLSLPSNGASPAGATYAASLRNPFMTVAELHAQQPEPLHALQHAPGGGGGGGGGAFAAHMNVRQQAAGRPGDPPPELPDHLKPMVVPRGRGGGDAPGAGGQLSIEALMAARDMDLQQQQQQLQRR
jgi:hypothetical protein